jgi:hypothetical protein
MPTDIESQQELTVRGESIERTYGIYREERYLVNRRYQRKLIWTLEEKVNFIDSILRGYPVPIILLAEDRAQDQNTFELIDGMQRMNAVMSFVENEYDVKGYYFDLNTMASTKALLDDGVLKQRKPTMPREQCVKIASYQLPFSIFEFVQSASVDEVFRRINSGGRQLSRQELRAAGALGQFADVVRRIAIQVRGDASHSDRLKLNDMKRVSITNKDLPYGIDVDEVFWVREGILEKNQVRQSRDEELIADLVGYMVSDDAVSSRSEFLDDYFGVIADSASKDRYQSIERSVQRRTAELVISDFQRTLDALKLVLGKTDTTFGKILFKERSYRAPRYFQAVFLAFFDLIVRKNHEIKDYKQLSERMSGSAANIEIQEGGQWGAEQRQRAIDTAVGLYSSAFGPANAPDPALVHWITQLQNLLSQSYTEQSAYDFKQGFLNLDSREFDEDSFEKILKTCVGISNLKQGSRGYVIVGVAENKATAKRVSDMFGVFLRQYETFYVTGVEHESTCIGKSLDQLFQMVIDKVKSSPLSADLRDYIVRNLKPVRFFEKTVYVFEVESQRDPSSYADVYYTRHGAQLAKVEPSELPSFFRRYDRGS